MKKQVVVLGAGISGLTRARALKQRYNDTIDLQILESSSRAGGWIETRCIGDFLFELGPRSCRSYGSGFYTLQLIESLGLAREVIPASPDARQRYLWTAGRLHMLPTGLISALTSPLMKGVPKGLFRDLTTSSQVDDDPSIRCFIGERLGYEIADRLFDPLVTGIYAGDISKLSMRSCFPPIYKLVHEHGSIVRGAIKNLFNKSTSEKDKVKTPFIAEIQKSPIFTLQSGMGRLIDTLAKNLSHELQLGVGVVAIEKSNDKIILKTCENTKIAADELHMAIPACALETLFKTSCPQISEVASKVQSTSITTVSLGWKNLQLAQKGFGYLIPSKEKEDLLGVVWDSYAFPSQNKSPNELRLTAMIGGAHRQDLMSLSDGEIQTLVARSLHKHLGIKQDPDAVLINRAFGAIPQYYCGHSQLIETIIEMTDTWSGSKINLLGNSWKGVSVNDCIKDALSSSFNDKNDSAGWCGCWVDEVSSRGSGWA